MENPTGLSLPDLVRRPLAWARLWVSAVPWRLPSLPQGVTFHMSWALPAIYVAALAVRLLFQRNFHHVPLQWDEVYYWQGATGHMMKGFNWLAHPPMWPFALKLPALFSSNPRAGVLFCVLLASAAPVVVYVLGRGLFDRRTGLIAAFLVTISPQHVYFSSRLFKENLSNIIVCLATWAYISAVVGQRPRRWKELAALAMGVALLGDEKILVFFFGLLVAGWWSDRKIDWRSLGRELVMFLIPFVMATAVLSVVWRRPVFLLTSIGLHLHFTDEERNLSKMTYRGNIKRTGIVPIRMADNSLDTNWIRRIERGRRSFRRVGGRVLSPYGPADPRVLKPVMGWIFPGRSAGKRVVAAFSGFLFVTGLVALVLDRGSPFRVFTIVFLAVVYASCLVMQFRLRYQAGFLVIMALNAARLLSDHRRLITEAGALRLAVAASVAAAYITFYVR